MSLLRLVTVPAGVAEARFAAPKAAGQIRQTLRLCKKRHRFPKLGSEMDKVEFPYRSSSHLILMHVVAESGAWEKYGLDVNYNYKIGSLDAQTGINSGELEFCSGNHVSTYGLRARGSKWVYLGQTVNNVYHSLVVRPDSGINGVQGIRGKKLGGVGSHPILNNWLYLKQRGLDQDRGDYELVCQEEYKPGTMDPLEPEKKLPPLWHWVRDGIVDAAFVGVPASLFAQQAGLKVIDVEPLPMIQFSSISTNLAFVQQHPDLVERFMKGLLEGIAFFKTRPDKAIEIIQRRYTKAGPMTHAQAAQTYAAVDSVLEAKMFPTMQAIANVYEEALRQDPEDARKVNPMELWDLHHLRQLDDSGFIASLYGNQRPRPAH
jgi:ABC-type nitrate/sulfonate/bicarbonate transport system substrate-binding protein